MRKCKVCGEVKELGLFRKRQIWRSHTCKTCYSSQYATGKPNTGRFQPGHIPANKGKSFPRRTEPKYKKIGRALDGTSRQSYQACNWLVKVLDRDGHICQTCGSMEDLIAHHIIP